MPSGEKEMLFGKQGKYSGYMQAEPRKQEPQGDGHVQKDYSEEAV